MSEKKKVLIAEDTKPMRIVIKTIMESINYNVIEVENGSDAIEKAVECKPDLILMDIMMPRVDGIQATLQIKKNPKTKNIPLIMLTALTSSDAVLTSYDYGANYYLNKPFSKEELLKAINIVEKSTKERGL